MLSLLGKHNYYPNYTISIKSLWKRFLNKALSSQLSPVVLIYVKFLTKKVSNIRRRAIEGLANFIGNALIASPISFA